MKSLYMIIYLNATALHHFTNELYMFHMTVVLHMILHIRTVSGLVARAAAIYSYSITSQVLETQESNLIF